MLNIKTQHKLTDTFMIVENSINSIFIIVKKLNKKPLLYYYIIKNGFTIANIRLTKH